MGTSYNEQIHLWDINPTQPEVHSAEGGFLPSQTIIHNNMVGRDVTEFKATWSNCPSQPLHFTVGSLTKELDFFKPDGSLIGQLWSPEVVQAPAVTAAHPSKFECQWRRVRCVRGTEGLTGRGYGSQRSRASCTEERRRARSCSTPSRTAHRGAARARRGIDLVRVAAACEGAPSGGGRTDGGAALEAAMPARRRVWCFLLDLMLLGCVAFVRVEILAL